MAPCLPGVWWVMWKVSDRCIYNLGKSKRGQSSPHLHKTPSSHKCNRSFPCLQGSVTQLGLRKLGRKHPLEDHPPSPGMKGEVANGLTTSTGHRNQSKDCQMPVGNNSSEPCQSQAQLTNEQAESKATWLSRGAHKQNTSAMVEISHRKETLLHCH